MKGIKILLAACILSVVTVFAVDDSSPCLGPPPATDEEVERTATAPEKCGIPDRD